MHIHRIQVEEGFLDGLDLSFTKGLNVIIGPRGSGKTSIIELIRFCLNVPGFTEKFQSISRQHALSILGSGKVTVTLTSNGEEIKVIRSADEDLPRKTRDFKIPLIFSQNEIEAVGLEAKSRLKIIDGFRENTDDLHLQENEFLASIRTITVEMKSFADELQEIRDQIGELKKVKGELEIAQKEKDKFLKTVKDTEEEQLELQKLNDLAASAHVRISVYERTLEYLDKWESKLGDLITYAPIIEDWPEPAKTSDKLMQVRDRITKAVEYVKSAKDCIIDSIQEIKKLEEIDNKQIIEEEDKARKIRMHLEGIKKGAGDLERRVAVLKERESQFLALEALSKKKQEKLHELQERRRKYLKELELLREERYSERLNIAQSLNEELNPLINISIERAAQKTEYYNAISAVLRGSGLHYNTLASLITEGMSPRELIEALEMNDVNTIAELTEISADRSQRLISHIKNQGGQEEILTCPIEDGVKLSLLDGNDYKATEYISTGQRCTVMLPILLIEQRQSLVIDQPEDNLDNSFIADTLIRAILKRKKATQLIFSTHNPNIPVLGDADLIILLGSDGERGYVQHTGELFDKESVKAITSVMEGGLEAFRRRAEFYEKQF